MDIFQTTRVSWYQNSTILILLEQVWWRGWWQLELKMHNAPVKSSPPTYQLFTGSMPFLSLNEQLSPTNGLIVKVNFHTVHDRPADNRHSCLHLARVRAILQRSRLHGTVARRPDLCDVWQDAADRDALLVAGWHQHRRLWRWRHHTAVTPRSVSGAGLLARRRSKLGHVTGMHAGHFQKFLKLGFVLNLKRKEQLFYLQINRISPVHTLR